MAAAQTASVLRFESVTRDASPDYTSALRDISFELLRGQLLMIHLERPNFNPPLADLACGVVQPDTGRVQFRGHDWDSLLATSAACERGKIGRCFQGRLWVSNLNIDENVLLPHRHHFRCSDRELCQQANQLARHFGLEDLPETRPAVTPPEIQARAALVRAFLGEPSLLLLERPEHHLDDQVWRALYESVAQARQRGAAVVWMTGKSSVVDDASLQPDIFLQFKGQRLEPA